MFSKSARGKDGLRSVCKPCDAEQQRRYHEENREKVAERQCRRYEANREKAAERQRRHYEANREKVAERKRRYSEANPHVVRALAARRRAAKLQAVPAWARLDTRGAAREREMVALAYRVAALATKVFGVEYHVDHVVPLRGRKVSGLHCLANLRIVPAVENLRKNSKLDPLLAVDRAALARTLAGPIRRGRELRAIL